MRTVADILQFRATEEPKRLAFRFASRKKDVPDLTSNYGELHCRAAALASKLRSNGAVGSRVVITAPPGHDFVIFLFGCFYADMTAVPTYPPINGESISRFKAVIDNSGADLVLVTPDLMDMARKAAPEMGSRLLSVDTDSLKCVEMAAHVARLGGEGLAILQYTSGSTGRPKGVMVSHANLMHNLACIERSFGHSKSSRGVIWLPPYHDMGLIGGILQPVYCGFPVTLMSPRQFLLSPFSWLKRISDERATTSGGPNLAFELCLRKITPEQRNELDLSDLKVCFSGSEAVRADTVEQFCHAFQKCGFRRNAFLPCYGLAESTLIVSGSHKLKGPLVSSVRKETLNRGKIEFTESQSDKTRQLVSCGSVCDGLCVKIVDPITKEILPDGRVGELWVNGPSVARGYWNNPELSQEVFYARPVACDSAYLRTGDLGTILDGDIYITSRLKELVIIGGRKLFPEDMEDQIRNTCPQLSSHISVIFSDENSEEPGVMILQEIPVALKSDTDKIGESIHRVLGSEFNVKVAGISFVKRSTIPTTLTGKIQRIEAARRFFANELPEISHWPSANSQSPVLRDGEPKDYKESLLLVLQRLLGRSLQSSEADKPLVSLGLDSLSFAELSAVLVNDFRRKIPEYLSGVTANALLSLPISESVVTISMQAGDQAQAIVPEGQRGLWFTEQNQSNGDAYILGRIFTVRGNLPREIFQSAVQVLTERHPMLRTRFVLKDGILTYDLLNASTVDCICYEDAGNERGFWTEKFYKESRRSFDLSSNAPFRAHYVRLLDNECLVMLAVHHIAVDFHSLEIIYREFWDLCAGTLQINYPAARPLYYGTMNRGVEQAPDIAYWRQKLSGAGQRSDFPRKTKSNRLEQPQLKRQSLEIPAELVQQLTDQCKAKGYTFYVGLIASFKVLLSRYVSTEDIIVGTIMSIRPEACDRTVGYFVNPIVLRTTVRNSMTFIELLQEVDCTVGEARKHSNLAFSRIVAELQPERQDGRTPFFAVLFNYLNSAALGVGESVLNSKSAVAGKIMLESIECNSATPRFDFAVHVHRIRESVRATVEYDCSAYDAEIVALVLENWNSTLRSCMANPHGVLGSVSFMSSLDTALLSKFNDTFEAIGPFNIFLEAEKQWSLQPKKVAIWYLDRCMTYEELANSVSRVAASLAGRGVQARTVVAILMQRSPELIASVWGVLKIGAAFLVIDPALPKDRIAHMLGQSKADLVIDDNNSCWTRDHNAILYSELQSETEVAPIKGWQHTPDDPAYVIFTSGSTGRPKGAVNIHAGLANLLRWLPLKLCFTQNDIFAQKTNTAFDVSVWELLLPGILGAQMAIIPMEQVLDSAQTRDAFMRHGVTVSHFVPSMLRLFLSVGSSETLLRTLRVIMSGGEKMDVRLKDDVYRLYGNEIQLWNLYGPAEATIDVTFRRICREDSVIPIGRPAPNMRVHILDRDCRRVPVGAEGEICIAGVQVGRGYIHDENLTCERFVSILGLEDRLYRTGDKGRWLPTGEIEYLGRIDEQVKIRGVRIELGEIEQALCEIDCICSAAVLTGLAKSGNPELHAYVELSSHCTPSYIRNELRKKVLDAMVPSKIFQVAKIPLNISGKLDRMALRKLSSTELRERTNENPAIADPITSQLAKIFCEILHQDSVRFDEHFFSLGGHSLQLIELLHQIHNKIHISITLKELMENPTVLDLSKCLRSRANLIGEAEEFSTKI